MAGTEKDPAGSFWHIDKKVPAALILTIMVQTAGIAYWVGALSNRVDQLERSLITRTGDGDRITRLEVKLENMVESLHRIERAVGAAGE